MSSQPPWQEDDRPPWEVDDTVGEAQAPPKNPFAALAGSKIEGQPSLLSRIGSQAKGFAQELPLIGMRGLDLLRDIGQGNRPWDPAQAEERAAREAKYSEWLGAAKPGEPEQRIGRIAARMVPGAAAAYLTGGMSLPAQAAIQGGVQGFQSLSEGASPEAAGASALLAGAAPGAGKFVNALLSKVKAPFAGAVDTGAMGAAQRLGIELPASAATDSSVARGLEQMASRMVGGGPIEARGARALEEVGTRAGRMGAGANPMLAGERVAGDYGAARSALQGAKNVEYGKVGDLTQIPGVPQQTLDELDRLIAQGTLDPDTLANLRKLRAAVAPGPLAQPPVDPDVEALLRQFQNDPKMLDLLRKQGAIPGEIQGPPQPRSVADLMSQQAGLEYGGPNALREAALSNRLRGEQGLGGDIDQILANASPAQAAQLPKAKAAYGKYADLSQSELGRTASRLGEAGQFDKIAETVIRPGASQADLKRLMDVTSPETQDRLREVLLQKIVGNAEHVTPKQIERGLYTYRNAAKRLLTPEQLRTLRDISKVREAMGKTTIGSPTTPLLQARKYLETPVRAALAGSAGGLAGIGAELGSEALIARLLGSRGGQRWLTTGFPAATLPGKAVRGAGLAGARAFPEMDRAERERALEALLATQR